MLYSILKPLASLKLTVVLLALAMLLIFCATWAQIDRGIWHIVSQYFRSFVVIVPVDIFLPRTMHVPIKFPLPGGITLGSLMLVNLLAAHSVRFKLSWKRSGIFLIHLALIILLVGEAATGLYAREWQMPIYEGQTSRWAHDIRAVELAVIDHSDKKMDRVVAIPQAVLQDHVGQTISDARLPFDIFVDQYMVNAQIMSSRFARPNAMRAADGIGKYVLVEQIAPAVGVESGTNYPAARVTLKQKEGQATLGQFTTTPFYTPAIIMDLIGTQPRLAATLIGAWQPHDTVSVVGQKVAVDGKSYSISLRFARTYKDYALRLIDFKHDKYTGTGIARNFSSLVQLTDSSRHEDRHVTISMNHPLRYQGETFYQSNWIRPQLGTILQVVDNPAWLLPYIACSLGGLGLLVHFGIVLRRYLSNRHKRGASTNKDLPHGRHEPPGLVGTLVPWLVFTLGMMLLIFAAKAVRYDSPYDLATFAKIPVSYQGRVKPIDTVARNVLMIVSKRQSIKYPSDFPPIAQTLAGKAVAGQAATGNTDDQQKQQNEHPNKQQDEHSNKQPKPSSRYVSATQWLSQFLSNQKVVGAYQVIYINHPDIFDLLGWPKTKQTRFSLNDLTGKYQAIFNQANLAGQVSRNDRNSYQRSILKLANHLQMLDNLRNLQSLHMLPPPVAQSDWLNAPQGRDWYQQTEKDFIGYSDWGKMLAGLSTQDSEHASQFNQAAGQYLAQLKNIKPVATTQANRETFFNRYDPFWQCMLLYVVACLLVMFSWLGFTQPLIRSALILVLLAFVVHSLGLGARIYLSGRPPVTNLYSSAVFAGWGCVLLCLLLEWFYRNGMATLLGALIGYLTLQLAWALTGDGDTMAVLQAVLDTNIWLATHVVIIVLGYSATYLAGFLGIAYILRGLFTRSLTQDENKKMGQMLYGIVCVALLFSFIGTVLGGIWGDQSWGRFWGWDPKENGAVLIVLWNALILHARWAGLVKVRGMAILAVFGNVVTTWSWKGTNMLGVGLHAYGFIDAALAWMVLFIGIQLLIMVMGSVPLGHWRSFAKR